MEIKLPIPEAVVDTNKSGLEDFSIKKKLLRDISLSEELEERYRQFQKYLEQMSEAQQKEWFAGYFNTILNFSKESEVFSAEYFSSLIIDFEYPELEEVNKRYGKKYCRPFFRLSSNQYENFYRKLRNVDSVYSAACTISGGRINENETTKGLELTIGSKLEQETIHELRHSIDSNSRNRIGKNKIIDEFIGYYTGVLYPTTHEIRDIDGNVTDLIKYYTSLEIIPDLIIFGRYYEEYQRYFSSKDDFDNYVKQIGKILLRLSNYFSKDQMDVILFNTLSVDQLNELLSSEIE